MGGLWWAVLFFLERLTISILHPVVHICTHTASCLSGVEETRYSAWQQTLQQSKIKTLLWCSEIFPSVINVKVAEALFLNMSWTQVGLYHWFVPPMLIESPNLFVYRRCEFATGWWVDFHPALSDMESVPSDYLVTQSYFSSVSHENKE